MLFQALKPAPGLMAIIGAGMVVKDSYGTLNEATWLSEKGEHRIRIMQLYAEEKGNGKREVYLGGYRYYYSPLDTYLEGTAGKFWTQDTGALFELKRFFGDTAVTIFYKNSVTTDGKNHQAGGIQFSLPLTPRRDMQPYPVQIRGSEEWSYAQETGLFKSNYLGTPTGIKPEPPFNIGRVFYDRDRLSEAYIRRHLLRLRDAYQRYANGQ
jgi:hypothetical protein